MLLSARLMPDPVRGKVAYLNGKRLYRKWYGQGASEYVGTRRDWEAMGFVPKDGDLVDPEHPWVRCYPDTGSWNWEYIPMKVFPRSILPEKGDVQYFDGYWGN